ncbi:L-arabinose transport system permease protein AraP [bioreactor metagenome]|uniref:L-arabinose transport system permease protein AraP n=1 Tax=bioreactor metagenome TaxID=1076179 RepID=A0A644YI79_9ZZZZ|nr:sugar ABC transporter permease [Erysipelotrichaceae bacterium]
MKKPNNLSSLSLSGLKYIVKKSEPLLYLLPFFLGIAVFTLYPIGYVFVTSFKEGFKYISGSFDAVGLANYQYVISDPNFSSALKNTSVYVFTVVPISTVLAIVIAYLLNQKIKLISWFQTAYFLPMVTSITAVGLAWKFMLNTNYGVLNYLITLFGADKVNWLMSPKNNIYALIIFGIWNILPFTIIILLAGLQNINELYYTAAKVDGAKPMQIFQRITIPLLAPTIGLVLIINMISSFKVFTELFPLFNGSPGIAYNLYTVVYYIYDQFYLKWKFGRASAAALILFIIIFVLTRLQLYVQRKWQHY